MEDFLLKRIIYAIFSNLYIVFKFTLNVINLYNNILLKKIRFIHKIFFINNQHYILSEYN